MGSMNVLCCSSVVGERTGTASRLSYHQYDFVCGHQVKGISIKMSYINNIWYYIQAQTFGYHEKSLWKINVDNLLLNVTLFKDEQSLMYTEPLLCIHVLKLKCWD